jgi:transposase InsO family protein
VPRAHRLGLQTVLTPVRAPRANAIAERLVGTLPRDCLDHLVSVNEAPLRAVLTEFGRYTNPERPHRLPRPETPTPAVRDTVGPTTARPVLGGRHHIHHRAA